MLCKHKIESLYQILLQKNLYNQSVIKKYYQKIKNNQKSINQIIQKSHQRHLPFIKLKNNIINNTDIRSSQSNNEKNAKTRQKYNQFTKTKSQIHFKRIQPQIQVPNVHNRIIKTLKNRKNCNFSKNIINQNNFTEEQTNQYNNARNIECKNQINLKNILFHNNSQRQAIKYQFAKSKKFFRRRDNSKHFIFCSQTKSKIPYQTNNLRNKQQYLLTKYLNSSIDWLFENNKQVLIKIRGFPKEIQV